MNTKLIASVIVLCFGLSAEAKLEAGPCERTNDCRLVQDTWCRVVIAVPKNKFEKWKKQEAIDSEKSKNEMQTCKPTIGPELELKNFRAECKNQTCSALFIDPKMPEN